MDIRKIYLGLVISFMLCVSCGSYNTFPKELSKGLDDPAALKALIDDGQTVDEGEYRIVDVRPVGKYAKGHIPTAINLPNGNTEGVDAAPSKDKMIIVYCETGGRAEMAAKKMAKVGYEHIYNFGGFGNWPYEQEK